MPLAADQHAQLTKMLSNEMDMCFRQRAFTVYEYLNISSDDVLFDCGCGRGFYVNMSQRLTGCRVIGLELERELIAIAKTEVDTSRAYFLSADITKLPFADNSFSKVVFSEVLEHLSDDRAALAELYRVMKPGATLAVTVPNRHYPFLWDPINWILEATIGKPIRKGILAGIWANHERLYEMSDLREKAKSAGFNVADERLLTYHCFPFIHNIVYGVGKELLTAGLLPASIAKASDRFRYEQNTGSGLNPINFVRRIFLAFDKLNEYFPPKKSSVCLAMKLVKA